MGHLTALRSRHQFSLVIGYSNVQQLYSDGMRRNFLCIRALSNCGGFRGNRAPALMRAACASLRPLDVHKYVFGAQFCTIRLA